MLRRGKHGQTCGNCFNPCLSFEFLQLSSVFGLQHVANEQILFGVIRKIGRFKSFSAECSVCLQNTILPFLCLFPLGVQEEWSCVFMCGAFTCRHELWDFSLYENKSCHYICSMFPVSSTVFWSSS